ncbi:MAG: cysteine dioxygenase [Bacteroidales bacterium]
METLSHQTDSASRFKNNEYFIRHRQIENTRNHSQYSGNSSVPSFNPSRQSEHRNQDLFAPGTVRKMVTGEIPDLWGFCLEFAEKLNSDGQTDSAMSFIPLMQALDTLEKDEVEKCLKNPETRHVLASNERVEVILIHWKPGKASDIHGHPEGGCLFKLLYGKLEELRYTPEKSPKLLGFNSYRKGSLAYIDNQMAYHQVGNPYGTSAISLHIYLK